MHVKTHFSIKDLEQLSGVKAHTIRIWEKRYNLLSPSRSATNIRNYTSSCLQKLLNVTYLYNDGYKISKIAQLSDHELSKMVVQREVASNETHAIENFKLAMISFDKALFDRTFSELSAERTFSEIYRTVFVPFLLEIGILWQTTSIDPTHERFISEIIKQKIVHSTESLKQTSLTKSKFKFALFLPYNEIHEIGLLYANYEVLRRGHDTIYLGNNIPLNSLKHIKQQHPQSVFISYITMDPEGVDINEYAANFENEIAQGNGNPLWLIGQKTAKIDVQQLPRSIKTLSTLEELSLLLSEYENTLA